MNQPQTDLWYLPPSVPAPAATCLAGVRRLATIELALVQAAVHALDAAAPTLAALDTETIVAAIDAALACWREPADPGRTALLERGPTLTGYSRPALARAIDVMLPRFGRDGLHALLRDEFGDAGALDGFVPVGAAGGGVLRLARGPGRQFHVFAGAVPTAPIFSLICALLLKSPVLAKPPARDPLFPALFAQTLARIEPRLAGALAVLPWPGGAAALEAEALAGAGAVAVYGSDETVADLRRRTPAATRFLGYGHRLSVAAVGREALSEAGGREAARRLAWDVALFDQQGCLSPRFALAERGGALTPEAFADLVASELEALSETLPRGPIDAGAAAQVQALRQAAGFRAAMGRDVRLWHSVGTTDWTVICTADTETPAGCGQRTLTIVAVDDLARGLPAVCAGLPISTIGVAAPASRLAQIATGFAALATRICPLGVMGEPPVTWRHDGRPNLTDLVTWIDCEI